MAIEDAGVRVRVKMQDISSGTFVYMRWRTLVAVQRVSKEEYIAVIG